jgi:hypothetical protein
MVSTKGFWFCGGVALLLLLLSCPTAYGVLGDCNGDGTIEPSDAVFVMVYLSGGAPPAVYSDCDCDGFPGINFGDAEQIIAYVFMGKPLFPWPGSDLMAPANTSMMISGKVDGVTSTRAFIFINNPSPLKGGLTLPFSFKAKPGEADLDCASITVNPLFSMVSSITDNAQKTVLLRTPSSVPVTTDWEVLCEIDFVPDPLGAPGTAHDVKLTTISRYFPLLLAEPAYEGTDYVRMLFPKIVPDLLGVVGDANCDGMVDIADAVYLIMYIFKGGNPPGDPDGDGTPNCP